MHIDILNFKLHSQSKFRTQTTPLWRLFLINLSLSLSLSLSESLPAEPESRLAHLDLGHNGIGDEGAGRLAAVLGQCASLAHLDLCGNGIGDEGAGRLGAVAERADVCV